MRHPFWIIHLCLWVSFVLMSAEAHAAGNPWETWTKRNPLQQDGKLLSIAGGEGMYVAGGEKGNMLFSSNLVDWVYLQTEITGDIRRVVRGGGKFAALVGSSKVYLSTDGIAWQPALDVSSGSGWIRDIDYGAGVFCAITSTNSSLTSATGESWILHPGTHTNGTTLDHVNGLFVTVSTGNVTAISSDGATWSILANSGIGSGTRLYHLNNLYIAVSSQYGTVRTTASLVENAVWTTRRSDSGVSYSSMAYGNGKYVLVGDGPPVRTSADLVAWATTSLLRTDEESGETFLCSGGAFLDGLFVLIGENGGILTSPDGSNWTLRTQRAAGPIYNTDNEDVAYFQNQFVVINYYGLKTSKDGIDWGYFYKFGFPNRYSMVNTDDRLMGVGYGGGIWTTTNLIDFDWGVGPDTNSRDMHALIHAGGLYVTVGVEGRIYTSPDLETWTQRTSGVTVTLRGVAYGNGMYVVVGSSGTILTSTDGVTWTKRTISGSNALNAVGFGGGKFVALGFGRRLASSNGINWTSVSGENTVPDYYAITYARGRFFTVEGSAIYVSTDGSSFTKVFQAQNGLEGIRFGRDRLIAVGTDAAIYVSESFGEVRPTMGAVLSGAGNGLVLTVEGEPQRAFELQHSPDLQHWTTISSHIHTSTAASITNEIAPTQPRGFFRVISP